MRHPARMASILIPLFALVPSVQAQQAPEGLGVWTHARPPSRVRSETYEVTERFVQAAAGTEQYRFVVDPTGYIVTNYHVIDEADKVKLKLHGDSAEYKAKIIGHDVETDLAPATVERLDRVRSARHPATCR